MELENLNIDKNRLEALINRYMTYNQQLYLKLKQAAQQNVINLLKDGKILLQYAIISVLEALRRFPYKQPILLISEVQSKNYIEYYKATLSEVAEGIYKKLFNDLVNDIIAKTTAKFLSS
jgi:hypothetical protein